MSKVKSKVKLEGYVSIVNPIELNAILTGEADSRKFKPGQRVRCSKFPQLADKDLIVNEVCGSDPRWLNCRYEDLNPSSLKPLKESYRLTTWLKHEDLEIANEADRNSKKGL